MMQWSCSQEMAFCVVANASAARTMPNAPLTQRRDRSGWGQQGDEHPEGDESGRDRSCQPGEVATHVDESRDPPQRGVPKALLRVSMGGSAAPGRRRDSRIEEMMARARGLVENVRGLNKLVMQLADDLYTFHKGEEGHRPRKGRQ
jgi:hypothetical protein